MENCPKCQTLLTEKSKEYVEEYQKATNGFLFDQLIRDIENLEITKWEKIVLLRQINLLRYNFRSQISYNEKFSNSGD